VHDVVITTTDDKDTLMFKNQYETETENDNAKLIIITVAF
jgi:hypothetical protein